MAELKLAQIEHKDTDIAIVGIACLFPGAENADQYWQNLANGVDSIVDAPNNRINSLYFENDGRSYDRFYCNRGGFLDVPAIDPMKYGFLPISAKGMEPEHLLMMKLSHEALEDASVFAKGISVENCCVIIGKGNFGNMSSMLNTDIINTTEQILRVVKRALPNISDADLDRVRRDFQDRRGKITPDTAIALMPNLIAALVTNKLNMHGPAYTVDGACASSTIAIDHASQMLLSGQCDIALAAGLHISQSAMFMASFNMLGAISHKGEISPFSEDADGLLPSEGAGVLVLKTLKKARADKDRIYALIKSSAVFSDGAGVSVMAPNTNGQQLTIAKAWEKVDLDPRHVGLIEAHGTATLAGDKVEINTLNEFFGNDPQLNKIWLGSVKSNIGHTMPAAGMAGVIKVALALHNRKIPPTLHAEKPAKALVGSRFELPQTLIDWDEEQYPLVAGVNAFGFGGINSHLVMTAYDNRPEDVVQDTKLLIRRTFTEARVIAADSKEELLRKIDDHFWMGTTGRYRLVIFDPTEERVARARSIVERDKPWKGRLDIWFNNEPLLQDGGKLAFLFSGFNMEMDNEVDSIADYLGLERPQDLVVHGLLNHALKLYQVNDLLDTSLKQLGVTPDMNAGHSIGEWHAGKASGMVSDANVRAMMDTWVRDANDGAERAEQAPDDNFDSGLSDVYFVAVGSGYKDIEPIVGDIADLYLSNDNCNSQVLMCGRRAAVDEMCKRLNEQHIFNQELPFQSGYHTPFIAHHQALLDESLDQIVELHEATIPVWSATSLEQYPTDMREYRELTITHLTTHIRFRELIEKLYDVEDARVFVSLGAGHLSGFVDDILRGRPYSTVSTYHQGRSGIEQLRRVLGLLFVEGKVVDTMFIRNGSISTVLGQELEIENFSSFVNDFPVVEEIAKKQDRFDLSMLDEIAQGEGADAADGAGADGGAGDGKGAGGGKSAANPLERQVKLNMREMSLAQKEMLAVMDDVRELEKQFGSPEGLAGYVSSDGSKSGISRSAFASGKTQPRVASSVGAAVAGDNAAGKAIAAITAAANAATSKTRLGVSVTTVDEPAATAGAGAVATTGAGAALAAEAGTAATATAASPSPNSFQEEIAITTANYPYVTDHTVVKQPEGWSVIGDLDVVVPMTMSIELMMEIAQKYAGDLRVLSLNAFSIYQWMNVFDEFKLQIAGKRIANGRLKLEMKNFIETEVELGAAIGEPPQKYLGDIDLGKITHESPTKSYIYDELMFHGPMYQGVLDVTGVYERGLTALVKDAGGKGSLLDTLGQLIGIYLRTIETKNNVSFPVNVGKISFYQDLHDQEGLFEFTLVVKEITDDFINGDMILKRDGRIWCVAENWLNRRFEFDETLWNAIQKPLDNMLGRPLADTPLVYFDLTYPKTSSWPFIEKRYLNHREKEQQKQLLLNKRRPFTISRVAAKDAARKYLREQHGKRAYPVEIAIEHDDKGKPQLAGLDELHGLHISLAHKGNEAVAYVSTRPVGADIELVEERSPDFMELSFSPAELELLADKPQDLWSTRFWTAKEAYGKMLGTGLGGDPRRYEVSRIDGEVLYINEQAIHTTAYKDRYIVAWVEEGL